MTNLHKRKFSGAGAYSNIGHLSRAFGANDLLLSVQQWPCRLSSFFNILSREDTRRHLRRRHVKFQQFEVILQSELLY